MKIDIIIDIIIIILWIVAFCTIWYKDGLIFQGKKWTFVPCTTYSESRIVMASYVKENIGSQYRLTLKNHCYGFEYR